MIKNILFILFVISAFGCFQQKNKETDAGRVYFNISPDDRKILIPVQFNDSIIANLIFDTGGKFVLDSAFCALHPVLTQNNPDTIFNGQDLYTWGSTNAKISPYSLYVNSHQTGKIGDRNMPFKNLEIMNWYIRSGGNTEQNGLFNIPNDDSTNVWELNFDDDYLKIHDAENFVMPDNCFMLNLERDRNYFYINFPLLIKYSDGETIMLNRRFLIDTAAAYDIFLINPTDEERDFFSKRDDGIYTWFESDYHIRYTVEATLFEDYHIDSLRIYTFDHKRNMSIGYIIGFNFLKRFNVFFDMKNKKMGLQPVKKFKRVVNPGWKRFHYSINWEKWEKGKCIVDKIAKTNRNYFYNAGLRDGDEIVSINGVLVKNLTAEDGKKNKLADTLICDIIRNKEKIQLIIPKDKNEEQGD